MTGTLLAAAALLLALWSREDDSLPVYALRLEGGARTVRGAEEPADAPRFRPGSQIEIALRPEVAATEPLEVVTFARATDGEVRRWSASWERASTGAFRLAGPAGALLDLPDGEWALFFVVGRAGHLPGADADAAHALESARADPRVRVLESAIRIEGGD